MIVDELLKKPGAWLSRDDEPGIILSSRVRLARNVRGVPFPAQARADERIRSCATLRDACNSVPSLVHPFFFDMGSLDPLDKAILKERRLISRELAEKGEGSGLIVAENENTAIMINEEDHLRLQAISPGADILSVWKRVDAVDTELESKIDYAFSPRLGYLTSCPSNVGTGLRASVMLHLPGLHLQGEAEAVVRGLGKIGLAVRGLFGEGSQAFGSMFQVSNQVTLGQDEESIIKHLVTVIEEVVGHERNARMRLLENRRAIVMDKVARAVGILAKARMLSSGEAVELLSMLRMGVEFGVVTGVRLPEINEIMLTTQPGHLQKTEKQTLGPMERDEVRAEIVRRRMSDLGFTGD
ncbi:MAG: protein arginine kinase [Kiritimatiellia bacterium]|jgi:protein arginine kinase|nr:protein arginine kinase [Kiritimatiellia bacterium]